jgi:hypothetical protein
VGPFCGWRHESRLSQILNREGDQGEISAIAS